MASFEDCKGRQWNVVVNLYTYGLVKDTLDVDLLDVLDEDNTIFDDDLVTTAGVSEEEAKRLKKNLPQLSLFYQLAHDVNLMSKVVYLLCKEQADEAGIDNKEFMIGISGDELYDAQQALFEAIANFSPPQTRPMLNKILRLGKKTEQRAMKLVDKAMSKMDEESVLSQLGDISGNQSQGQELIRERESLGENSNGSKRKGKPANGTEPSRSSKRSRQSLRALKEKSRSSSTSTRSGKKKKSKT